MIKTYRQWAAGFVIFSLLVLVVTYICGWILLHSNISNGASEVANTIYVGGFIAAVTAISLWVVRIVMRLYMSQHHLTIDAEERAAMLKTFLALSEEKKVGDTELGLILSAIFRPTPDGIIKDEGVPMPIGIGSLLGAALDSKSK
jgi:hypothetical protein